MNVHIKYLSLNEMYEFLLKIKPKFSCPSNSSVIPNCAKDKKIGGNWYLKCDYCVNWLFAQLDSD